MNKTTKQQHSVTLNIIKEFYNTANVLKRLTCVLKDINFETRCFEVRTNNYIGYGRIVLF